MVGRYNKVLSAVELQFCRVMHLENLPYWVGRWLLIVLKQVDLMESKDSCTVATSSSKLSRCSFWHVHSDVNLCKTFVEVGVFGLFVCLLLSSLPNVQLTDLLHQYIFFLFLFRFCILLFMTSELTFKVFLHFLKNCWFSISLLSFMFYSHGIKWPASRHLPMPFSSCSAACMCCLRRKLGGLLFHDFIVSL